MIVASKENIPMATTTMSIHDSSPTSTTICLVSTAAAVSTTTSTAMAQPVNNDVVDAVGTTAVQKDLVTMDSVTTTGITNVLQTSASKKRSISETSLATTTARHDIETGRCNNSNNNNIVGTADDIDDGADTMKESMTEASIIRLEANNDTINTTDQDQQQPEQDQEQIPALSNDGNNIPTSPAETTTTISISNNNNTVTKVVAPTNEAVTTVDLQRPVKRARTAYFLFLDDYRSTVQKEVCVCM